MGLRTEHRKEKIFEREEVKESRMIEKQEIRNCGNWRETVQDHG